MLLGQALKIVPGFKYLGVVFSETLCIKRDVVRTIDSFLKHFKSIYFTISFADMKTLGCLFKTYTLSICAG